MKIARFLGLAVVAVVCLTASVGAGTAFAETTGLCKTGTVAPYCETADRYSANTAIEATTSQFKIVTNLNEISCTSSSLKGATTAESGQPLPVSISSLSFGGCTSGAEECVVSTNGLPASGSISRAFVSSGTLSFGSAALNVVCSTIVRCEYAVPSLHIAGGGPPSNMSWTETKLTKIKGLFCPHEATLKPATWTVSTPQPMFVARAESAPSPVTGLCSQQVTYCEPANLYPKGTLLSGESTDFEIRLENPYSVHCASASASTKTAAAYGEPLGVEGTEFTQSQCNYGSIGCALSDTASNGSISRSGANGLWRGTSQVFRLECNFNVFCQFVMNSELPITFEPGAPPLPTVLRENVPLQVEKGQAFCPHPELKATYSLSSPSGALYFTDVER